MNINLKKSFVILTFFVFFFSNFYAQNSNNQRNNSEQTNLEQTNKENLYSGQDNEKSFESNSNYFNNNSSAENNEKQTKVSAPSGIWLFIRMIFVLVIVIALIYGVLWFIKNKTNVVKTDDEFLRRASFINIAPGKSIEVITLVDKAYIIGVTEDNITLLGELDPEKDKEMINAMNLRSDQLHNTKKPLNFSEVLNIFLAKNSKKSNIFEETEQQVENMFNSNSSDNNKGGEDINA